MESLNLFFSILSICQLFLLLLIIILFPISMYYLTRPKDYMKRYCSDCGKDESLRDVNQILEIGYQNYLSYKYHICNGCIIHRKINDKLNPPSFLKRKYRQIINYFIHSSVSPKLFKKELYIIVGLNILSITFCILKYKFHVIFGFSVVAFYLYQCIRSTVKSYYYHRTKSERKIR